MHITVNTKYGTCKIPKQRYETDDDVSILHAIDKTEYFINQCKDVHDDKYDYTSSVYVSSKKKITITCPHHGDFKQLPTAHKKGHGCPCCASLVSMYDDKIQLPNINITLYIIKCFNDNEQFYKIGITSKDVHLRFKYKHQLPYDYEVIDLYTNDIKLLSKLERRLHDRLKHVSYKPHKRFAGHTECFSKIDDVQHVISEYIK